MDTTTAKQAMENVATQSFLSPFYTTVLGIVVAVVLFEVWVRTSREYKMLKNIPTLRSMPVLGNALELLNLSNSEMLALAFAYQKVLGNTIWVRLGPIHVVSVSDPADVELILSNHTHNEKAYEYRYFHNWFGNGLLVSNGKHWYHHRKMIAPTFHQSILKSFVPNFNKYSKNVINRLEKLEGVDFDCHHYMSETTVEILLSTAMCVKNVPKTSVCGEYAKAVVGKCDLIHKRQLKLWYRFDPIYNLTALKSKDDSFMKTILSFTRNIISERRKDFNPSTDGITDTAEEVQQQKDQPKNEGLRDDLDDIDESDVGVKRRLPLLDAMVEMTRNPEVEWNEKDIRDEVNTIMFEGHDTTAAGSAFTLCMLGLHKDIQQKVFEEQQQIFGDDMKRDCTFADTLQMNYLERVIKETLRLYPPVPLIARKLSEDVKLKSGPYTIPKNTTVLIAQFAIHRSTHTYENPMDFNPDNFLPENVSKKHYYSYIPFSAGPRSCVGRKYAMLMLKVLLSNMVRNFYVDTPFKNADEMKLQGDIILKVEQGFQIRLTKRA